MHLHLDPRLKLLFLVIANISIFFNLSFWHILAYLLFFCSLLILEGKYKIAIKLIIVYLVAILLDNAFDILDDNIFNRICVFFIVFIKRMIICYSAALYVLKTTKTSELIATLYKLRIPKFIIIPIAVVLRFFPTLFEDIKHIYEALLYRGIFKNKLSILIHPFKSIEYFLVPILMNSNIVADDLAVASLSKGLELENEHTSIIELKYSAFDLISLIVFLIIFNSYFVRLI